MTSCSICLRYYDIKLFSPRISSRIVLNLLELTKLGVYMKNLMILAIIFSVNTAMAFEVQLGDGETVKTVELNGRVSVSCQENTPHGPRTNYYHYYCQSDNLASGNYGKVRVVDGSVDADWVKLQREGSRYIKGVKFNSATNESTVSINLWITTLFQKPLLTMGTNTINYTFTKNRVEVEKGTFNVLVETGESRSCRLGNLHYYNYCPGRFNACGDYFRRHNYCK